MLHTFGAVYAGHVAFHIEAGAGGRVIGVHEQCVLVLDVVSSKGELDCITRAFVGLLGVEIVRDCSPHVLRDTESVLTEIGNEAICAPICAGDGHCHTLVGNRLVHVRICAQGKVIAECGSALNLHINCASVYRDNYRMAIACVNFAVGLSPSAFSNKLDVIAVGISLYLILNGIGRGRSGIERLNCFTVGLY